MQSSLHALSSKLQRSTDRILSAKKLSETCTRGSCLTRKEFYGGDPCNAFHALRQFLLNQGIDTRLFTYGSISLPKDLAQPALDKDMGSIDNSFYFEFHKVVSPEFDSDLKVNVLVLLVRCFFDNTQDSNAFHVQLVLNHHKDAIFELNEAYDDIIGMAEKDDWAEPSRNATSGRITYFEKAYTDVHAFKKFVKALQKAFDKYQIYGNDLIPNAPVT